MVKHFELETRFQGGSRTITRCRFQVRKQHTSTLGNDSKMAIFGYRLSRDLKTDLPKVISYCHNLETIPDFDIPLSHDRYSLIGGHAMAMVAKNIVLR
jgi:hypothetical protein